MTGQAGLLLQQQAQHWGHSMIKHFLAAITGNVISLIGTLMIILSLLFIGALLVMQAMGFEGGAYLGIVTFVLLPMGFLLGIIIVPLGIWLHKRRDAKAALQALQAARQTERRTLGHASLGVPSRDRAMVVAGGDGLAVA